MVARTLPVRVSFLGLAGSGRHGNASPDRATHFCILTRPVTCQPIDKQRQPCRGFKHHREAWAGQQIRYFAHVVKWK
jgi:hypothetical protein